MRKQRFITAVAVACVCAMILSGIALADAPATPQATPSPSATSGQKPTPPPVQSGQAQNTSGAADAIQGLGLQTYPNIYAGGEVQPDGSVVLYLGPGDDAAFTTALHALLASSAVKALGPEPATTIVRVPQSIATLNAAGSAFVQALPQLKAQGFVQGGGTANPKTGTYDVTFAAVPNGMTTAEATAELQQTISPLIRVTSVNAPLMGEYYNREHDAPPYYGSDLVRNPNGEFCTTGFTVIGTLGLPRATTAGHCGQVTGTNFYTNGGWGVTAPSPDHNSTAYTDGTPINNLGQTSNIAYSPYSGYADIQFLRIPTEPQNEYGPYIWDGTGTAQPTPKPVGNPYTSYPVPGTELTLDGAFSRMVRHVKVTAAGAYTCFPGNGICGMIEFKDVSADGVTPVAQPGDSGGPVFCYACYSNGDVKPAGLIEGGPTAGPDPNANVYATFIQNDLNAIGGGSHIYTAP